MGRDWLTGARDAHAGRWRRVAAAGLGALAALGQAPWGLFPATLLALAGGAVLLRGAPTWRQAALAGWLLGLGYFAVALFWIVEPFLVDARRFGWLAPFALAAMAGGLALFWGGGFALAHLSARSGPGRAAALVLFLPLAEIARSTLFTGFPWALPGYVWLDRPPMQLAALTGPWGLTLLTVAIAALPAALRRPVPGLAAAMLLLAASWLGGLALLPDAPAPLPTDPVQLRLVQPNAPQERKWDPRYAPLYFQRQLDLTARPADPPPDVVIWPESTVTFWLDTEAEAQARIAAAAPGGAPVALGAQRYQDGRVFNALAVLGPDGKAAQVYDKIRLVPFGEYIPFGSVLSRLGLRGLAATDGAGFAPGTARRLLDFGRAGKALPLICYEAIFPALARFGPPRPDWLLQVTNDAWFGTFSGPQQHLAQARFRAVEQGLPLVRVANTGISAVIDPWGRITASLPLETAGALDAALPPRRGPTLYAQTGDAPLFGALLLLAALLLVRRLRISD